ncbi:MAG: PorP/SprF family type IX secretion system membrane protein [Bacteroidetes bacterium]|nr:PorP/SprF family type IX secretion system membrane protein [Bacteroidota bacterium]
MMKSFNKKLIQAALAVLPAAVYAQDVHFSQYNETPVVINPALSSTAYDTRVIANYRNQWASVASPYQTYGLSVEKALHHLKLKKTYFGTSLTVYNDKAGDAGMGTLTAQLGFNVVLKVSQYSKLSLGLGGGINYRTLNPSKLRWESQYDGYSYNANTPSGEAVPANMFIQPDFSGGIDWHFAKSERFISAQDGTKADIGASVFHYNSPTYSYVSSQDRQYMKFVGHANFDIGIKGAGIALVPSLIYMRQGPAQELNMGFMFKYILQDQSVYTKEKKAAAISFGAYYRVKDAVIPTMLVQWDKFGMGLSYDFNLSQLSSASKAKGGLEISLRYNTSPGYGRALGKSLNRPTYK